MKFTFSTAFYLLLFFDCFSQSDTLHIPFPELKPDIIALGDPGFKAHGNISNLLVIDARFDTTSFGLYKAPSGRNYFFAAGTNSANEMATFLKEYLQVPENSNGTNIIMVIKKLWISNEALEVPDESDNKASANGKWLKGIKVKFEFYAGNGDVYTPFYRYDTVYTGLKDTRTYAKEYLQDVLIAAVQKLLNTDLKNVPLRKKMSVDDIATYSRQQFNSPIIRAESYKKGVYKTFDEFKQNEPSIINFDVKKDELTDMIFVKDNNGEYPVRDVWGYSDGRNLYVNSADNYFQLVRKEHTFVSMGAKDLTRSRHIKAGNVIALGVIGGGLGKGNKKVTYNITIKPYELDMETGEFY